MIYNLVLLCDSLHVNCDCRIVSFLVRKVVLITFWSLFRPKFVDRY